MAREVIKRVGARAYRYRVESYREGAKVRARWTYLGVVDPTAPNAPALEKSAPDGPGKTRERLIDAFERLVEAHSYASVTAGDVSAQAGLGHGTFYRYFKNKREILVAALDRVREAFDRVRPSFDPPYGTSAQERARVRAWTAALGTMPASRGVLAAWYEALDGDLELDAARASRARERSAALASYLHALCQNGSIAMAHPTAVAGALTSLVDATFRSAIVSGIALDPTALVGVGDVFDRAIFGTTRGVGETGR